MWYWHGMDTWAWLMMAVVVALVIVLSFLAFRPAAPPRSRDEEGPIRILDERLARGEIDREDYEERRRILQANR